MRDGIDVVGGDAGALAAAKPDDPAQLERHGTQMAGLLVGAGGPAGLPASRPARRCCRSASPAGSPTRSAHWAVYARTDQIIAGLERAVDPNDDGDAHDAARVALVALAEPFAAFADGPEARAVAGALALDTLVVAPAGNDGAAGAGFGSIAGPGGAPAALTVGAVDTRAAAPTARASSSAPGLDDAARPPLPLAGAVRPTQRLDLPLAVAARPSRGTRRTAPRLTDFFTPTRRQPRRGPRRARAGRRVAGAGGRARRARPGAAGRAPLRRRAALPAGALGLDEARPVPVVVDPDARRARRARARSRAAEPVAVSLGAAAAPANPSAGASPRSRRAGLAFDGRVKPDLVAPGVGARDAEPGVERGRRAALRHRQRLERRGRGRRRRGGAARAGAAGARRRRARRPARRHRRAPLADAVAAQGAGVVDVGAAAAGEVAATPATLAFGRVDRRGLARQGVVHAPQRLDAPAAR